MERIHELDRTDAWEKEQTKREAREKNRLNRLENARLISVKRAEREVRQCDPAIDYHMCCVETLTLVHTGTTKGQFIAVLEISDDTGGPSANGHLSPAVYHEFVVQLRDISPSRELAPPELQGNLREEKRMQLEYTAKMDAEEERKLEETRKMQDRQVDVTQRPCALGSSGRE